MGSLGNAWASEPIAIIGLSCKFAGSASSPEKLWEMLAEGRSAWSEIPISRFNVKGTHNPNHEKINTVSHSNQVSRSAPSWEAKKVKMIRRTSKEHTL